MKLTVLTDQPENPPFHSEFGLALLLEHDSGAWLFDTGAGNALAHNLRLLGVPAPGRVILSHGHADHTGGLAGIAPERIYHAPGVTSGHFSRHPDGIVHPLSMPLDSARRLMKTPCSEIRRFTEIAPGMFLTGAITRVTGEGCGGDFHTDPECTHPDRIDDEQALLTGDGILVTGCCHAGIGNTLLCCRRHKPDIPVRTVAGGLHLRNASPGELRFAAEQLRNAGVKKLCLLHCTGAEAVKTLAKLLPECGILAPRPGESVIL